MREACLSRLKWPGRPLGVLGPDHEGDESTACTLHIQTSSNWKPVKLTEKWYIMVSSELTKDNLSSVILSSLYLVKQPAREFIVYSWRLIESSQFLSSFNCNLLENIHVITEWIVCFMMARSHRQSKTGPDVIECQDSTAGQMLITQQNHISNYLKYKLFI